VAAANVVKQFRSLRILQIAPRPASFWTMMCNEGETLVHHSVGIHQDVIPILYEACSYIPGLTPDPVDPTEAEIQAWLRGKDLVSVP